MFCRYRPAGRGYGAGMKVQVDAPRPELTDRRGTYWSVLRVQAHKYVQIDSTFDAPFVALASELQRWTKFDEIAVQDYVFAYEKYLVAKDVCLELGIEPSRINRADNDAPVQIAIELDVFLKTVAPLLKRNLIR